MEHVSRCPVDGEPIDYCQGHGRIGDPIGYNILLAHDYGYHGRCHYRGCEQAPSRPNNAFTAMSTEGIEALCDANDRRANSFIGQVRNYEISLNPSDFRNFIYCLRAVWEADTSHDDGTDLAEWAESMASGIAQTLGIEFI